MLFMGQGIGVGLALTIYEKGSRVAAGVLSFVRLRISVDTPRLGLAISLDAI